MKKVATCQILNLEKILESLKLSKYVSVFKDNEIYLEDFFLLSQDDLVTLGLSLGA